MRQPKNKRPRDDKLLPARFCSIAIIVLCMGGLTIWNASGILVSLVATGIEPSPTMDFTSQVMDHSGNSTTASVPRETTTNLDATVEDKIKLAKSNELGDFSVSTVAKAGSTHVKAVTASERAVIQSQSSHADDTQTRIKALHTGVEKIRNATDSLPEALGPVTFDACCDNDDNNACLTERACNDPLYPFSSKEQAAMFETWKPNRIQKRRHIQRCQNAKNKLAPPTRWCSTNNTTTYRYPMGCSRYGMAAGSGPYDRLLLFPEGKLAFCGVPKGGITQWLQFLRFSTIGANDYQSEPYYKYDVKNFTFDHLTPTVQREILYNESWTKAILIREPAERLLSAYLDKIKKKQGGPFGPNVTFAKFVDILAMTNITKLSNSHKQRPGLTWFTDPHWRPQAWSCGLSEDVKRFHYIGGLDKAAFHTKALLQKVNMWESYGKHYRVSERGKKKGTRYCTWPPAPLKPGEEAVGFQQKESSDGRGGMDAHGHHKGSRNKLDEYYTPKLMKKVKELYWMDFALWDAIQEAEMKEIVSGKDIVRALDPECS